jgi:type IV secretory pathway TrbD component
LPQRAPVDLSEVKERLGNLESQQHEQLRMIDDAANRIVPLEATADKARQLAEEWPELQAEMKRLGITAAKASGDADKAIESVTAVAGVAGEAVSIAGEANATVGAALDEDAPDGLVARIRSRVHDKVAESITAKLAAKAGMPVGQMAGIMALGFGVIIWLVRKDVLDKAKTGDPLFIEKLAAHTRNTVDDRLAAKIGERAEQWGSPDHGLREELADIRGMLAKVTGKK